ncbi:hypothetical protein FRB94_003064 [Tulasnella sp. JGI-2019a]|nr:hypothetical protein FRB94_003064 [Tulasnella sp. JGI-2019a]KAG9027616.1 hypothetical protein FRB95_007578 [Tulasnella sp. JGI-2019a]
MDIISIDRADALPKPQALAAKKDHEKRTRIVDKLKKLWLRRKVRRVRMRMKMVWIGSWRKQIKHEKTEFGEGVET